MYLSRVAAVNGGLPTGTPALTLNRLCGSGLQAIVSAAQALLLGDTDVAVAGGAESMSRGQYWLPDMRWGRRMQDAVAVDAMVGALTDPFEHCHMGVTAENVAAEFGVSRADQDALAAESHRRAARATEQGYFDEQITPVEVPGRKGTTMFNADEHIRPGVSRGRPGQAAPGLRRRRHGHRGNASGINDAAAAVVLATARVRRGSTACSRSAAWSATATPASIRGSWGSARCPRYTPVLDRTGLKLDEIDVFEVNEAFAAQAWPWSASWPAAERTNPNGSGISLGHPIGATGAILAVKALYELHRTGGRYALTTMCIGGGQGIAAIFERV